MCLMFKACFHGAFSIEVCRYMSIIFSKQLLLLITCVGLTFLLPQVESSWAVNMPQATSVRVEYMTPQKLQQRQAVKQRLNLEIQKVLDSSQQGDLRRLIHRGDSFNQAIAKLEISAQQRELLKTIQQLYGLKLEALKNSK
jgi:hypothetical protein